MISKLYSVWIFMKSDTSITHRLLWDDVHKTSALRGSEGVSQILT